MIRLILTKAQTKDESDALLSDSKNESKDAVFNESFSFTDDRNKRFLKFLVGSGRRGRDLAPINRKIVRGRRRLDLASINPSINWDENTDESEDPSGKLSGENEDGSLSPHLSHISHAMSQTSTE